VLKRELFASIFENGKGYVAERLALNRGFFGVMARKGSVARKPGALGPRHFCETLGFEGGMVFISRKQRDVITASYHLSEPECLGRSAEGSLEFRDFSKVEVFDLHRGNHHVE
jgi:hypothetical protein